MHLERYILDNSSLGGWLEKEPAYEEKGCGRELHNIDR